MTDFDGSPAARGFYMPPEWSTHEHCWMDWPQEGAPWMDAIEVARMAFADVARQISRFEPVTMIAAPWQAEEAQMTCGPSVNMKVMPLNDCWTRDFGPGFVVDGEGTTAAVAWRFNGYGNRFAHDLDEFFGEGGDVILFVITRYYYRYLKPFGIFSVNIHYIYYLLNLPNFLLINTSAYNHL